MKEVIIGVAAIVLLAFVLYQKPNVVNPMGSQESAISKSVENHASHSHSTSTVTSQPASTNSNDPSINSGTKNLTGNAHYDQMPDAIKKSLKDSLLLENTEGTDKTFTQPDGTVVMPSRGLSTQMPVAVQMPDGSIQIREYSSIPKVQPVIKVNK